jgi:hypothetical protein
MAAGPDADGDCPAGAGVAGHGAAGGTRHVGSAADVAPAGAAVVGVVGGAVTME